MRVNVVHSDLDPCGGAEQVCIETIRALLDMNHDVDLTVAKAPNAHRLKKVFGKERIENTLGSVKSINLLGTLKLTGSDPLPHYDLVVNTHGDMLPYYSPSLTVENTITYCHYPVAVEFIMQKDRAYLDRLLELGLVQDDSESIWDLLLKRFLMMLKNSLLVTNSSFSKDAIVKVLSADSEFPVSPIITPPPVCTDEYRVGSRSNSRKDQVLVISRIDPVKEVERALALAKLLKGKAVAAGMTIAGNFLHSNQNNIRYLKKLRGIIQEFGISDFVTLELDVPITRLKLLMSESKVYFHPMRNEPFGISIVEAMSAGLVPVVPDRGGQTDFVPGQYLYGSLDQAADIIAQGMHASDLEREKISALASNFSPSLYTKRFQAVVSRFMLNSQLSTALSKRPVRHSHFVA